MANKNLFHTLKGALLPQTTTCNDAGAAAYELSPEATLARMAVTGCLTSTFYASAEVQLDRVLALAQQVDVDFLAQAALYARRSGYMKDMPALFCAVLASRDLDRLAEIFPQVIDNGRMLRNFVQILRSGVTGRKSLGSAPKRLIRQWLERASDAQLLSAAVGNHPSLADIVKMVHPRPKSKSREAFFGWLIGRPHDASQLPEIVQEFEAWKETREGCVPDVPFQMLTALDLSQREWAEIAENAGWHATRMNLNTFARHGVFQDAEMAQRIARKLTDVEAIRRAKAFPYQLLAACRNVVSDVPQVVRVALEHAMESTLDHVPEITGSVVVCADVSGSMHTPVTGYQPGAAAAVRCIDVAGLVAAAFLRKNPCTQVLPFEHQVVDIQLNARDTVFTNATRLAEIGGGGTNCSAPLQQLNRQKATPDLVIYVSDNESWIDTRTNGRNTSMMEEWRKLKQRHPSAKLVCLDLVPNTTTQAPDRKDILNIGGFSDHVFQVIASFAEGSLGADHWIREIQQQPLLPRMKTA